MPNQLIKQRKPSRAGQTLTSLNERHREIIDLLVYGIDGKLLTTNQIAERLRMRPGYVHGLMSDPLFRSQHDLAWQIKRDAAKPAALNKIIETVHRHGEGAVADARLQLDAAKTILGDEVKSSPAVNVQINNQVGVQFKPGYVIRLPAQPEQPMIEAQPIERSE